MHVIEPSIAVNLLLRFDLVTPGSAASGIDYMAIGHRLLPAVPRAGEEVFVLGRRLSVEKVQWDEKGAW